jgi:hypothetical protein
MPMFRGGRTNKLAHGGRVRFQNGGIVPMGGGPSGAGNPAWMAGVTPAMAGPQGGMQQFRPLGISPPGFNPAGMGAMPPGMPPPPPPGSPGMRPMPQQPLAKGGTVKKARGGRVKKALGGRPREQLVSVQTPRAEDLPARATKLARAPSSKAGGGAIKRGRKMAREEKEDRDEKAKGGTIKKARGGPIKKAKGGRIKRAKGGRVAFAEGGYCGPAKASSTGGSFRGREAPATKY